MNIRLVAKKLFNLMNDRDLDLVDEIMNAEIVLHFPISELIEGIKKTKQFFRILYRMYPHLAFSIKETIM